MRISPPPLLRLLLPAVLPLVLLLMLGLSACSWKKGHPADTLPEASQLGLNTAGCRVDGVLWTATIDALFGPPATLAIYDKKGLADGSHLLLLTFDKSSRPEAMPNVQTSINILVPNLVRPGTFVLTSSDPHLPSTPNGTFFLNTRPIRELHTSPLDTGLLTVTHLDTTARIVSGTFEFTAREASGASSVRITDGRFDCKF